MIFFLNFIFQLNYKSISANQYFLTESNNNNLLVEKVYGKNKTPSTFNELRLHRKHVLTFPELRLLNTLYQTSNQ